MAPEALSVNDPRVQHNFLQVDQNIKYHYIVASPQENPAAVVLLLHGWPDLAHGWRFQVPYLLSLGLRVVVPDMLGYGQTSAPDAPAAYSLRNMSDHLAQLIRAVSPDAPVVVGAHDWGAFLAWRLAMYHPDLVRAVFCFCIPFAPPQPAAVVPLEDFVEANPVFAYQLQNAGPEAEALAGQSPAHLRGFLNAMFGGTTPDGLPGFDPYVGLIADRLLEVGPSPLVSPEAMHHYVSEFSRNGLHGPMNWYRTRSINGEEELPLAKDASAFRFQIPAMLIMAGQDPALTPDLADGQEVFFAKGLKKGVIPKASHWILIHCPEESNRYIGEFVKDVLSQDYSS
ncbi:Alpha/Beta hydrolase protein [Pseudomassariella vexata]|uniref:Alpha/Beta hydrolase protein n=1 Tax=Pseudomassariella vexata TaxID=1141098 RepID=A0A1Y2EIM1_9PEZI|nr:Alpha/Beta hydrolase protein [Pseudomassariella vexata]ORY71431.1 Alpha/Beta hydrolase protein [Pseudomassariella vexata]